MLPLIAAAELLGESPEALDARLRQRPALSVARQGQPRLPHETMRTLLEEAGRRFVHQRVTFGIEKGGVGKSFLAVNTAAAAAARGGRVLLVDLDPQACATNLLLPDEVDYENLLTGLEIFPDPDRALVEAAIPSACAGVDLVAAKGKMRRLRKILSGQSALALMAPHLTGLKQYDLVIFDIPPTYWELISGAYLCSDRVVLPVLPDIWSIESVDLTLADIADACEEENAPMPPCHVLLNRYVPARTASREAVEALREHFADRLLPFSVRETATIQNAINEGRTVFQQSCAPHVREALLALAAVVSPLEPAPPPRASMADTPNRTLNAGGADPRCA